MANKFRKKPVVIEAIQFSEETRDQIQYWSRNEVKPIGGVMKIETLEGTMTADIGDWIIRGVKGEFYPCKPDIFEATYEACEGGRDDE